MVTRDDLCSAINRRQVIRFRYKGQIRTVEPHLLGMDEAGDDLTLSAWQRSGGSGIGWRDFHVSGIRELASTGESFAGTRPGYNRWDQTMSRVICRL